MARLVIFADLGVFLTVCCVSVYVCVGLFVFVCACACAAPEPPCGDGAAADGRADEQHDGEDLRPLLHRPHACRPRAGQHRHRLARKGAGAMTGLYASLSRQEKLACSSTDGL